MASRIARYLSSFNPSALRWVPVRSETFPSQRTQSLVKARPFPTSPFSLITWNIDFGSALPNRRANGIIDFIFETGAPDILFLQEVRSDVRASLLSNPKIREAFLTTDAEDDLAFEEDKVFATMSLLSSKRFAYGLDSQEAGNGLGGGGKFMVGPVFREQLPSASGRDGLYLDIIPPTAPDTFIRLINVHLDSRDRLSYRTQQLKKLASVLREPGCSGGLIAGDFNSVSSEDHKLIDENGLEDAWLSLHGSTDPDAPTWSAGRRREPEFEPKRLDKVAMMGLRAEEMEILNPGFIEAPKPGGISRQLEWSDHSGLKCIFTV